MVRVLSPMVSIKVMTRALATRRVVKDVYAAEGSERKGGKRSDISILLALSGRSFTCEARYSTSPIRNLTLTQTYTTSDVIPAMLNVVPHVCVGHRGAVLD